MNDNELADRTHRTAEAWEKIADGRANDERLTVSGYQAHDTAQTLRQAAARLRELSAEVTDLTIRLGNTDRHHMMERERRITAEAENERLRAAGNELAEAADWLVAHPTTALGYLATSSAAWRAALGEES